MVSIILADEHDLVRQGIRTILEQQSEFSVIAEANNGLQAFTFVKALHPDVLIIELTLPNLNGLELTRRITEQFNTTHVIVLSMYAEEECVLQALISGARGYVLKNGTVADLTEAILTVSQGQRYLCPLLAHEAIETYIENASIKHYDAYSNLTQREREIIQLVAEGNTSASIATLLYISSRTVETHRANLMRKLGLRSQSELIRYAIYRGIVSPGNDALYRTAASPSSLPI